MDLETYISEAISSRRNSKYLFPDHADKDKIVEWLDGNGYAKLKNTGFFGSSELIDHYKRNKEKCYTLGLYENPGTSWIMIYDGVNVYFIRTLRECENIIDSSIGNLILRSPVSSEKQSDAVNFKDIKKEIEKNARY